MSDEQPTQEQQQPQFPQTNFNLLPNGLVITTFLTPDLQITKFVNAEQMNQICAGWHQMQKQAKQELQLIQDINNSRGRENLKLIQQGRRLN